MDADPLRRVVDDGDLVIHMKIHPPGSNKVFVGLAVSQPTHVIAASWWRVKGLLAKATLDGQGYKGFGEVRLPGFGESIVSVTHAWVAVCDQASINEGGDGCAVKGDFGKWVVEVR